MNPSLSTVWRRYVGIVAVMLSLAARASGGMIEDAESLLDVERYREARALLIEGATRPELGASAMLLLTRARNEERDWRHDVEHGERAVVLLPRSGDADYEYAVAWREKLSGINVVRAIFGAGAYKRALTRALELDPDHIDARADL